MIPLVPSRPKIPSSFCFHFCGQALRKTMGVCRIDPQTLPSSGLVVGNYLFHPAAAFPALSTYALHFGATLHFEPSAKSRRCPGKPITAWA